MTLWAFVSDVHSRGDRLGRVLDDLRDAGADRVLSLGDVGSPAVIDILERVEATHIFGNWEASGLRGLPQPYRGEVHTWPAYLQTNGFWAAHASPVWPNGLGIQGVVEYLRQNKLHWTDLFPSFLRSEDARWAAFAELEAAQISSFFHGHTHVQDTWRWQPGMTTPQKIDAPEFEIPEDGSRWLIGVGSVGDARDGNGACYALYDDMLRRVTLRRV